MSEAQRIIALSRRALARGEQLCLATVVQVEGSAYRKPGARMLLTSGGERAGTISGGCLESEVSRKAWWLTASGARVERYSSFADEDGGLPYGLGCGGTVSLLLEQGPPMLAVLDALERVLETRRPAVVVIALGNHPSHRAGTLVILTLPPSPALPGPAKPSAGSPLQPLYLRAGLDGQPATASHNPLSPNLYRAAQTVFARQQSCLLGPDLLPIPATELEQSEHANQHKHAQQPEPAPTYFLEYLAPPPAVTIFGAGDDAQPISEIAHTLGWRVTVVDGRAHLARRERFPQAAQVRVLDYADPALRAACGIAQPPAPDAHAEALQPQTANSHLGSPQPQTQPQLLSDEIAVILTHSYQQDRALLTALLPRPLRYLGILGPRHRTERLLTEVAPHLGLSIAQAFERLHSPIGLDIGAGDPASVALAIVSQIQAVLNSRQVTVERTERIKPVKPAPAPEPQTEPQPHHA